MSEELEKYRNPHESYQCWQLKKRFMEENREYYDEDRLASLAEVFVCSRFLGCVYPKKTMDLVRRLSGSLDADVQTSKSQSLQRTMVSAQFAAKSFVNKTADVEDTTQSPEEDMFPKFKESLSIQKQDPFSNFFIIVSPKDEDGAFGILTRSSSFSKVHLVWDIDKSSPIKCTISLQNIKISVGHGTTAKEAKCNASEGAIKELRKRCYTLNIKAPYCTDFPEVRFYNNQVIDKPKSTNLTDTNIGFKLLKSMGWDGKGGLGKNLDGISEITPIIAEGRDYTDRAGLGMSNEEKDWKKPVTEKVMEYVNSESMNDLVFSTEFDREQRKFIHQLALKYGLRSKSIGKGDGRQIFLSRKIDNQDILKDLIKCGGVNERYELVSPANDSTS